MTQIIKVLEDNHSDTLRLRKLIAVCDKHGETEHGQLRDLPPNCFKCAEEARIKSEAEQKAKAKQEALERFTWHQKNNGINPLGKKFDDWKYDDKQRERQEKIIAALNRYAENFNSDLPNILMIGGTGSGKTMLANAIAQTVFVKNHKGNSQFIDGKFVTTTFAEVNPSHLITSSQITTKAKATWGDKFASEDKFLEELGSYPLLIIDDLGDGDTSHNPEMAAADRNRLSQVISKRYQKHPTIITTNMGQEEVTTFLGDRAWDRLQEKLVVIKCDWDSYRQATAKVSYL
ncbi:ATP-binding protein [Psychrobacter pygoscelis]|uniref:ATP-binding protein n=1 Tax=Psychrobacter pygoscelis TaxID=2488563 RepID=UPI00103BB664|nr:ATP-binding protein [Psychrobacter pygoscelis]